MGWEQRRGGRQYYYQKRRQDGQVTSLYLGGGDLAQMAAILDAAGQEDRQAERAAIRQERADQRAIDQELDALGAQVGALAAAILLANGCHLHKGQWRRKR